MLDKYKNLYQKNLEHPYYPIYYNSNLRLNLESTYAAFGFSWNIYKYL